MNTQLSLLERCRDFISPIFEMQNGGWDGVTLILDLESAIAAEHSKEQVINQYEQAIDDELVNSFLGTKDDFKDAKSALLAVIDWNCKVALDPSVSPEAAKLLEQAKPPIEILNEHGVWADTVLADQILSDCGISTNDERLRDKVAARIALHREEQAKVSQAQAQEPDLVQIASDIMGACVNGDLSDKWEDVADCLVKNDFDGLTKLVMPQQEPVAYRYKITPPAWTYRGGVPDQNTKDFAGSAWDDWDVQLLYTSPQPLKPMSDEEIDEIWNKYERYESGTVSNLKRVDLVRDIEAKLGVAK